MRRGVEAHPYRSRLRYDSTFFLELQFCNEHGLPHSQFLEWEPEDRAKALAFILEKGERCVMCGTAEWEWKENRFAYEAVGRHCPGCYTTDVANEGSERLPGVRIELRPTNTRESAARREKARIRQQKRRKQ